VVASNYEEDVRIGPEILRYQADAYRRLRNSLRFLLGNLDGFSEAERVAPGDMPELERWVLHRLSELDETVRRGCDDFDFTSTFTTSTSSSTTSAPSISRPSISMSARTSSTAIGRIRPGGAPAARCSTCCSTA
jgi:isoleucyl-tRNA synthetase